MKKYSVRKAISEEAKANLGEYKPLTQVLLYHRGLQNRMEADAFLNPNYDLHTHDPFLFPDMEKSVERILKAIETGEKICIYSDYDMDGIPGAIVLHDLFKKIGLEEFSLSDGGQCGEGVGEQGGSPLRNTGRSLLRTEGFLNKAEPSSKKASFMNYIPHRHEEGFGLNHEAMEKIAEGGAKLLITLDCGIADVSEVEAMQKLGVDVIITDHHLPGEKIPEAFAILNPKIFSKTHQYPFDSLCGSGVAFKLVQAILKRKNFGLKDGMEKWFLDMVAMATCADMVPLQGENRVFAYYGLKVLRKSPRTGLLKLFHKLKVSQRDITEDDIGFTIAPRINAASRMGVPMEAFRLLATSDETEADRLTEYLNKINDERKGIVASMVKEMRKTIIEREKAEMMKPVLVMGNPNWKPSLLGLAANTLMESHARPVFLWGRDGGAGLLKGSCRSDGSVYLTDLMAEIKPGIFLDFGGHHLAGGFTVASEKVHLLEDELANAYEKLKQKGFAPEENFVDAELSLDEVNWDTYREIERLAPFGVGNAKPMFLFKQAEIYEVKPFGKEKNHLELGFKNSRGKKIPAISFFSTVKDFVVPIATGLRVNLIGSLEKSTFRNFPELRLRIVDII